jgi:hypothetical protein
MAEASRSPKYRSARPLICVYLNEGIAHGANLGLLWDRSLLINAIWTVQTLN